MHQQKCHPINRGGISAIAWLPLAGGSIFQYASANPSRKAGFLLVFPDCAVLTFPHCPSARSDYFALVAHRFMQITVPAIYDVWNYPKISFGAIT